MKKGNTTSLLSTRAKNDNTALKQHHHPHHFTTQIKKPSKSNTTTQFMTFCHLLKYLDPKLIRFFKNNYLMTSCLVKWFCWEINISTKKFSSKNEWYSSNTSFIYQSNLHNSNAQQLQNMFYITACFKSYSSCSHKGWERERGKGVSCSPLI